MYFQISPFPKLPYNKQEKLVVYLVFCLLVGIFWVCFLRNKSNRINYPSSLVPFVSNSDYQQQSRERYEKKHTQSDQHAILDFSSQQFCLLSQRLLLEHHVLRDMDWPVLHSFFYILLLPFSSHTSSILHTLHLSESTEQYESLQ